MTQGSIAGCILSCGLHQRRRAEHIMGMPAQTQRHWTARAVRQLIADAPSASPRYELVDGELLVTPSPAPRHQEAVRLLLIALSAYCERQRVGHALQSPSDIELEAEDVRQPDLFVLPMAEWRRVLRDGFPARAVTLAVEVISPSSARFDRVVKRPKYQRLASEYWIVDLDARLIERWRNGDTRPELLVDRLEWAPGEHEPFEIDLEDFFRKVWSDS